MKSNYKIGEIVEEIEIRNTANDVEVLLGLSINKCFIKSVANTIGTDLKKYKVIFKDDFAVSLMQVSRDDKIPIACLQEYNKAIVSPAYHIFRIKNKNVICPEYLEILFRRREFDREAAYIAVGGVRGSMPWSEFCRINLSIPPIEKQLEIVHQYKVISDRIALKQEINNILEEMLTLYFEEKFLNITSKQITLLGELMSFSNGKTRPQNYGDIPVYGGNGILSYTNQYNAENVVLIGRVGAYCGSVNIEVNNCWVSDNAIYAKSKLVNNEYFDYLLLKLMNLYDYHIGTGQQLLTQEILNKLECPNVSKSDIESFNGKAKPLFNMINLNKKEIEKLDILRNIILAKMR